MHLFKISVIDRLHDNGLDMRKQLLVIKSCKIIGLEYQQSKKTVTVQILVNLFIDSETKYPNKMPLSAKGSQNNINKS